MWGQMWPGPYPARRESFQRRWLRYCVRDTSTTQKLHSSPAACAASHQGGARGCSEISKKTKNAFGEFKPSHGPNWNRGANPGDYLTARNEKMKNKQTLMGSQKKKKAPGNISKKLLCSVKT